MTNVKIIPTGLASESIKYRTHNYEGSIIEQRSFQMTKPMSFREIAEENARIIAEQKRKLAEAKASIARPEHESKIMPDERALLLEFAQCKHNSVDGDISQATGPDDLYTFVAPEERVSIKKHLFQPTLKSLIRKGLLNTETTLSSDYIAFTQAGYDYVKGELTEDGRVRGVVPVEGTRMGKRFSNTAPPTARAPQPRAAKGPTKKGTVLAMLQSHPTTKEEIAHELAISVSAASSLINDLRRDGHSVESSRQNGSTTYMVGRIPTVDEAAVGVCNSAADDEDGDSTYADRGNDTAACYIAEGMSEEEAFARAVEEEPKYADKP